MREFGWGLMIVGAFAVIIGLGMDVSVPSYDTSGFSPSSVVNIHLLQQQAMAFYGGMGLFVAGVVSLGLGRIEHAIGSRFERAGEPEHEATGGASGLLTYIVIGGALIGLVLLIATLNQSRNPGSAATTDEEVQNALDIANEAVADLQNAADQAMREVDR